MELDRHVDLALLCEKVPPLLEACLCDDDFESSIRNLRLTNKEFSRVALNGLRSFTLKLEGSTATDTDVCQASLLQHTLLEHLHVCLLMSGNFSPAASVDQFVHEAGSALSTLTFVQLSVNEHCMEIPTPAMLIESLRPFRTIFSELECLRFEGRLHPATLNKLLEMCPLLSSLAVYIEPIPHQVDPECLDSILKTPSSNGQLIDLSQHTGVTFLDMDMCYFDAQSQWLLLPPKLQHLMIQKIEVEPPASFLDGLSPLSNLLTIEMPHAVMQLTVLAQLLRAAPALQVIRDIDSFKPIVEIRVVIFCKLNHPTMPADLLLLQERMHAGLRLEQVHIQVSSGEQWPQFERIQEGPLGSRQSLYAYFPCMEHVTKCGFSWVEAINVPWMLKVLPNLQDLELYDISDMDDAMLQEVAVCSRLTHFTLGDCRDITAVGLVELCLALPKLERVCCRACKQLTEPIVEECARALLGHTLVVDMVHSHH